MARILAGLFGLVMAAVAGWAAAEIPGREEPAFEAALDAWLADDEAAALPMLAMLAAEGNAAAKMLLALIDRTPSLQGPWLSRLPVAERRAILRAPGRGEARRNWMADVVASEPSAALWIAFWQGEATVELALSFAAAGELRAAREVLLARSLQRRRGLAERADEPHFPQALRVLALLDPTGPPPPGTVAPFAPGDPQQVYLNGEPPAALLGQWLMSAAEALPVAELCRSACGGGPGCALAAYRALGGHAGLMLAGSPSDRLIDPLRFAQSPRGRYALLRRALLRTDARGRASLIGEAEASDACFGALLAAEARRHANGWAAAEPEAGSAAGGG